jgi:assimilatory nitrate reductase catalytic subunit
MTMQPPPALPVKTTCPYCGVGCGVLARAGVAGDTEIAGDIEHPANFGRLCSKGSALGETLSLRSRLLHPMVRDPHGALRQTGWDDALDRVANGFQRIVSEHGPNAVAFYLSGQLLTEDYYVANKLMKGFIGSANVDTNSRLCMASTVAAHRRAFGSDTVPGTYEDIDEAALIVLAGSNAAWCHPVLFRRMRAARERRGTKIVVIDPRRTATAEEADLFLSVAPGMDAVLFSGLLAYLEEQGAADHAYIANHTENFGAALERARMIAPSLEAVAEKTGISRETIATFYEWFRSTERTVTCFSQGINQSAQGSDKANAIINCHLATGRIGKTGMGPFSLTGQPNAMGGREAGGLANQLAAHMNFSPPEIDRVRRFWNAPRIATHEGLKAVQLFDAIERGEIKALWVMATNPAVSLPRASAVAESLSKLELFVVSENVFANDTTACVPHVLLPAAAWGEKEGTVTNSERRISRQRAFMTLPGEARADWRIVADVARRMGFGRAFAYRSAAAIFREHAALSAFENNGTRDFDIGALAEISDDEYDALTPVCWPRPAKGEAAPRFFADGNFYTANRKARFVAPEMPALAEQTGADFPLRLNTGRVRDQWHTMTRTGLSARLGAHRPEPCVEIHSADAALFGLANRGFARLASRHGSAIYRVHLSEAQPRGSVFVPIHWSLSNSATRTGDMVAPLLDPYSGQPESKATPVSIAPVSLAFAGFALARHEIVPPAQSWWVRVAVAGGSGILFAGDQAPAFWQSYAEQLMTGATERAEYRDSKAAVLRLAAIRDGRLESCFFVGKSPAANSWDALRLAFAGDAFGADARAFLLSGKSGSGLSAPGPVVCACFGVSLSVIREAIESRTACSVDAIGKTLRAGTNCGSCLPELKRIVQNARTEEAV